MLHYKYSSDEFSTHPRLKDTNIYVSAPVLELQNETTNVEIQAEDKNGCISRFSPGKTFDETLQMLWNNADKNGLFRYSYRKLPTRIISEKYEFILQLNPERASKRRKPQEMQNVNQPFDPLEFNFNHAKTEETIMTLVSSNQEVASNSSTSGGGIDANNHTHTEQLNDESHCSVLINVSPLEYCHVLLVPFPSQNQPQTITMQGLKAAVEIFFLSHSCDFRVGFNSLCGFASVNHHHYHAYYLSHRLYIEHTELKLLAGPCWEFKDRSYPAPGFIFILKDLENINAFVKSCFTLISFLQGINIAHNMYITRGSSMNLKNHFDCIRLIVWGRSSSYGSKECDAFNPALCELAGHFPIKNELSYTTMTEEFIINELEGICRTTFTNLKNQVGLLWVDNGIVDQAN